MTTRHDLISRILQIFDLDLTPEQASSLWFMDLRSNGGLRLTNQGYTTLKSIGLQSYAIPFGVKSLNKKTLLQMNQKLKWPYFLDVKSQHAVLFHGTDAVMAHLYGDLVSWLVAMDAPRETVTKTKHTT